MTDSTTTMTGLRRGISLLKIMARFPEGCGFRQLQQHMEGLPAATLSRLLKVMIDEGLVAKDTETGSYAAGELAYSLSRQFTGRATAAELVQPVLRRLAEETRNSAAFARLEHDGFSFQAKTEVGESFHYMPTGRVNANTVTNGFGIMCLAYAPDGARDRFIGERREFLRESGEKGYRRLLDTVRSEQTFIDLSKKNMTRFVAAVFKGKGGGAAGAVGITVPGTITEIGEQQQYLDAVKRAALQATDILEGCHE